MQCTLEGGTQLNKAGQAGTLQTEKSNNKNEMSNDRCNMHSFIHFIL